ncbi:MAG TPA: anthranilate synthase component I family protein [Vicinamibacteria bacterium]
MSRLYEALRAEPGPCALFESTTPRGPLSLRSLLARRPRWVFAGSDPVVAMGELRRRLAALPRDGGIAGALAYDFARPPARRARTPVVVALGVDRFEEEEPSPPPAPDPSATALDLARHSNFTRARYRECVLRIKEHIARGDIYQANLSQRFALPWDQGGLALYERLRRVSPAPFAGYLRAAGLEIVSASPERLLSVEGDTAVTRPIAGTRPRSADEGRDRSLRAELLLSEKERAEHLMLVDLARNDLGQVARTGSVQVDELMLVEDYSHVRHIVSNVTARLEAGRGALDALVALFPGGTITGVPKKRCMEILDAVEPAPRGFYTGALFYVTGGGRLDANILIRSAVVREGTLVFHAGGGIVADSDPDVEYEETLHKAEAMRLAIASLLT